MSIYVAATLAADVSSSSNLHPADFVRFQFRFLRCFALSRDPEIWESKETQKKRKRNTKEREMKRKRKSAVSGFFEQHSLREYQIRYNEKTHLSLSTSALSTFMFFLVFYSSLRLIASQRAPFRQPACNTAVIKTRRAVIGLFRTLPGNAIQPRVSLSSQSYAAMIQMPRLTCFKKAYLGLPRANRLQ